MNIFNIIINAIYKYIELIKKDKISAKNLGTDISVCKFFSRCSRIAQVLEAFAIM